MTRHDDILAVEGIHIDGFGPFRDQRVALARGLNVVTGPNEAGKTALLQFILYALFPDKADRAAVALAGGRLGGRVFLSVGGREITVERHGREAATLIEHGRRVEVPGGVTSLLGGVDRALFGRVYAFSAAELLDLEALGDGQARERLFAGAVAGAGRSVNAAQTALKTRREQIWRPRGAARLGELDAMATDIRMRLDEARERLRAMGAVRDELRALETESHQLQQQWDTYAGQLVIIDAAQKAWPVRVALRDAESRLHALQAGGVPTAERFDEASAALKEQAEQAELVARTREALAEVQRERDAAPFDAELVARSGEVRRAMAGAADAVRASDEAARLGVETAAARRALDTRAAATGLGADGEVFRAIHAGPTFVDNLRKAAREVEQAERVVPLLAEAEEALTREEAHRDALRAELATLPEAAAVLVDAGRQPELSERVQGLRAARSAVARRDTTPMPDPSVFKLSLVLVLLGALSCIALVAASLLAAGLVIGLSLVVVGVLFMLVAREKRTRAMAARATAVAPIVAAGFKADVDAAQILDALDAALDMQRRIEVAAATGGSPELGARARAEARLAEAERMFAAAQARVGRLRAEARQAAAAGSAWQKALQAAGLPRDIPAGGCEALLREVAAAQEALRAIDAAEASAGAARTRAQVWLRTANDLLHRLGRATSDDVGVTADHITQLGVAVATHESLAATARDRDARHVRLQRVLGEATARLDAVNACLAKSTQAAEAAGVALDVWLQRFHQQRELGVAIDDGRLRLQQYLGDGAAAAAVLTLMESGDPATWQAQRAIAASRRAECQKAREELLDRRGRLRERLREAETDATMAELEQELTAVMAEREALVRELAELMLADELLRRALSNFRARHEPGVFRVASEHLRKATDGAWVGVTASEDQSELAVLDRNGSARESAVLSRGTRDLLYIALRLGLAHEQRPGGLLLPLVLDDVLVNLDPERANGLARVLAAEAARRQVLVLTCRPETTRLLGEQVADANIVTLARWAGATGPLAGASSSIEPAHGQAPTSSRKGTRRRAAASQKD